MTGFSIPDAIGGPGLATGTRWRPAQCLIRGAAGRQDPRAGEKGPPQPPARLVAGFADPRGFWWRPPPPVDTRSGAMAGFDVPGGSAAMPRSERVARLQQGLAGSGSTAAAARVTLAPAGKAAEEAHSGCDACRGRNAESLEGSGAPGWEHDCSQGGGPWSTVSAAGVAHAQAGKRASGRGHLVSDYAAIT